MQSFLLKYWILKEKKKYRFHIKIKHFRLIPVVINDRSVGITNSQDKYERGLLKFMQENKTDVISKMGAYNVRRKISQFTIPLWKTR